MIAHDADGSITAFINSNIRSDAGLYGALYTQPVVLSRTWFGFLNAHQKCSNNDVKIPVDLV